MSTTSTWSPMDCPTIGRKRLGAHQANARSPSCDKSHITLDGEDVLYSEVFG